MRIYIPHKIDEGIAVVIAQLVECRLRHSKVTGLIPAQGKLPFHPLFFLQIGITLIFLGSVVVYQFS